MRDMGAKVSGYSGSARLWEWCPTCPEDPLDQAERDILTAAQGLALP